MGINYPLRTKAAPGSATLDDLAASLDAQHKAVDAGLRKQGEGLVVLKDRLDAIEMKLARGGTFSPAEATDAGASLVALLSDAPEFESFVRSKAQRGSVPVPASALLTKNTITNGAGVSPQGTRYPAIVGPNALRVPLRQLLPQLEAEGAGIEFARELAFTNNAAPQAAEGAQKAESALTFELATATIPTLAHFVRASRQALSDSAQLGVYVDQRLRQGLEAKVEAQIIAGDGIGTNMKGLLHPDNHMNATDGDGDAIDRVRRAMTQIELAEAQADTIVLHPDDWEWIELSRNAQDEYIVGDPASGTPSQLWGTRVHRSAACPRNTFIVANLSRAAAWWMREDARVLLSEHDGDNFTKNLVTILAECRGVLSVFRPALVIVGELVDVETT